MPYKDNPTPREIRPAKGEKKKNEASPGAYHLFANNNQHDKQ
jgi:hypothetical protein